MHAKRMKIILLSTVLVIVSILVFAYLGYRRISTTPDLIISTIQDGADMSIGRIHQTSTRDGRKEWSLEANSAQYSQTKKQVILEDLAVTYFLEDGSEVYLTAEHGTLNTASNDIEVSGNVVVKKDQYTMRTENLSYKHDRRLIEATTPVAISGDAAEISANRALFDLNTKKIELYGEVEGFIEEDIRL
jgi:LPS export ABC transporter protein LptC